MSFWDTLKIGSSALHAQRLRLDVISNNIANAETTHTAEGGPYQRQDVIFMPQESQSFRPYFIRARDGESVQQNLNNGGVKVQTITRSDEQGPQVYDPSHPDADENGFVTYPNVNLVVEMTNMISATRSYEASLQVIEAAKRMALKALDIGR